MVLPLQVGPGLMDPPPSELLPRFVKIRICVILMILATVGKLIAGVLFGSVFAVLSNSTNLIMNTAIGVSLLRYDSYVGKVYDMGAGTCCAMCADLCDSGLSCLHAFVLGNLVTVVLDALTNDSFQLVIVGFCDFQRAAIVFCGAAELSGPAIGGPSKGAGSAVPPAAGLGPVAADSGSGVSAASMQAPSVVEVLPPNWQLCTLGLAIFIVSTCFSLSAQSMGAYQGWRAIQQLRELSGGGGFFDGLDGQDEFGREFPISRPPDLVHPASERQAREPFQAFAGRGRRLID
eukprot:TRINITY_DN49322_c0_g1_i1.p1 TRINITY_DN49322_c0_g1~~TRINITY_DN49322_c0_g1_i1.p1  ORF type:complete len:290 (-),score=48.08 TRINITY_DN49322_c0_g1_i1:64-933(-)